jgi:hypothetical protein
LAIFREELLDSLQHNLLFWCQKLHIFLFTLFTYIIIFHSSLLSNDEC